MIHEITYQINLMTFIYGQQKLQENFNLIHVQVSPHINAHMICS